MMAGDEDAYRLQVTGYDVQVTVTRKLNNLSSHSEARFLTCSSCSSLLNRSDLLRTFSISRIDSRQDAISNRLKRKLLDRRLRLVFFSTRHTIPHGCFAVCGFGVTYNAKVRDSMY